jgi:hypothetical protein
VPRLALRLRRVEQLVGSDQTRRLEPAYLRRLVLKHWNMAFGKPTPERLERQAALLLTKYEAELVAGRSPDYAASMIHAMVRVLGEMSAEEVRQTIEKARREGAERSRSDVAQPPRVGPAPGSRSGSTPHWAGAKVIG